MTGIAGGQTAKIFGLPNFFAHGNAVATVGSAVASLPASNVKNSEPSIVARIGTTYYEDSWIDLDTQLGVSFDDVGLFAHTLVPGSGKARFVTSASPLPSTVSEKLVPATILASSNFTGAVASFDESPETPDASWVGPTTTTLGWNVRTDFATPAATPATGSDYQTFALWVRLVGTPVSIQPKITVSLWESGAGISGESVIKYVTQTGGQFIYFGWDAADLATSSGANVEVKVSGSAGDNGSYCELGALEWGSLSATDQGSVDFDSGWLGVTGDEQDTAWESTRLTDLGVRFGDLVIATDSAGGQYHRFEFREDGLSPFVSANSTPIQTPATVIDVGHVVAGASYLTPYNFTPGLGITAEPTRIGESRSIGGQTYAAVVNRRRIIRGFQIISDYEEIASLLSRIDYATAGLTPFVVVLARDAIAGVRRHTSMLVTVEESSGLVFLEGFRATGKNLASVTYTLREKL